MTALLDRFHTIAAVAALSLWTCLGLSKVGRASDGKKIVGEWNKGRGDILTEHDENLAVSTWLSIELLTGSLTNMSHQILEPLNKGFTGGVPCYLSIRYSI